jgi:hypothetical protein
MRPAVPLAAFALLLAACASPSPEFFGAELREVERGAHGYVLFLLPDRAQTIRMGTARQGTHVAIMADMVALVAEATGCRPVPEGLTADSGVMTFRLADCPVPG